MWAASEARWNSPIQWSHPVDGRRQPLKIIIEYCAA